MRCTPNLGQGGGVFFMSKFTLEFKLECIEKFKNHKFWSVIVFFHPTLDSIEPSIFYFLWKGKNPLFFSKFLLTFPYLRIAKKIY